MFDYQKLYNDFVTPVKSLLIAPAGYGKTHTIAESLKFLKEQKGIQNQLILTHTHAGVASITEKVARICPSCKCTVETISSIAQRYVEAFYCGTIPEPEEAAFFPFIIEKATSLFSVSPLKEIIQETYTCLIVDEYQDCTISHHELILAISKILPTHILGDPLQGIFSFNGDPLVNLETDLVGFEQTELYDPWRWINNNPELGTWLASLRNNLIHNNPVDLSEIDNLPNCNYFQVGENDFNDTKSDYRKWLNKITYNNKAIKDYENILLITHGTTWQRSDLNQKLSYRYRLIEAFDEKDFYAYARRIDDLLNSNDIYHDIITLLKGKAVPKRTRTKKIMITRQSTLLTGLAAYFINDDTLPNPRKDNLKQVVTLFQNLIAKPSYSLVFDCLFSLSHLPDVSITRKELFYEICKAVKLASLKKITVYDAMKEIRNVKRRVGRKVKGKSIGTTLLTKGLEFDTVVVLDVQKFIDSKNLYVALTRASKRLIVFANNKILTPYK